MTKTEIVEIIAKERRVETIVTNITKSDAPEMKDLCQIVYLALLETKEEKVVEMWTGNWINYFLVGVIQNQISPQGQFYSRFKKWKKRFVEIQDGLKIYEDDAWERDK